MNFSQQTKQVMDFVTNFLKDHQYEDEKILECWNTKENAAEIEKIMKTAKKTSTKSSTEKKVKDPNKPKRGKSSYLFFCADNREQVKEDLEKKGEDFKATDVTKELGNRWNSLKVSKKAIDKKKYEKYVKQAEEDKERYGKEMADYVEPTEEEWEELAKGKKRGRKSSSTKSDKPKRGKTAYNYFCQENRPIAKEQCGDDAKPTDVTSKLGEMWKQLKSDFEDDDEEAIEKIEWYNKLSANDKIRYNKEMEDYVPQEDEEKQSPKPKTKKTKKKEIEDDEDTQISKSEPEPEKPKKPTRKAKKDPRFEKYCEQNREDFMEENEGLSTAKITKLMKEAWDEFPEEEKEDYA